MIVGFVAEPEHRELHPAELHAVIGELLVELDGVVGGKYEHQAGPQLRVKLRQLLQILTQEKYLLHKKNICFLTSMFSS